MRQRAFVHVGQPFFSPLSEFVNNFDRELSLNRTVLGPQFFETEDAYLASYDIPGVNFTDINIEVEEDTLTIMAERKNPFDKTGEMTKKYSKSILLPKNSDQENVTAHYENGVLSLAIPKIVDQKLKKKIQVLTGDKEKKWTSFLNFDKRESQEVVN